MRQWDGAGRLASVQPASPCPLRDVRALQVKEEALHRLIVAGEASLRSVLQSYLTHDHHERTHPGLGNQLMVQEPGIGSQSGAVVRRERLGGLLCYSHRGVARLGRMISTIRVAEFEGVYGKP